MMILWGATVCSNVILALLLVGLKHYVRYGFLTLWCVSSVLIDFLAGWGHSHGISLYPAFWLFVRYVFTFAIETVVILEAFKWRERRVEYPVSAQLFLGIVSLVITHTLSYGWSVYYFECFTRVFNLAVIVWMLFIFHQEPRYD